MTIQRKSCWEGHVRHWVYLNSTVEGQTVSYKIHVEVIILRTCKWPYWKLLRWYNQVNMRPSDRVLIQPAWLVSLWERVKKGHRHREGMSCDEGCRNSEAILPQARMPKISVNYQKPREACNRFSKAPRRKQPCLHLDFRLLASRIVREWISGFFATLFVLFSVTAWGN